ncbi:MAG: MBL fold metallo-hydrolase [Chthonomonadaceae bacterium]|uniref:Zn-dependent hydrolase n=1 Tax=Candidatus Nitrosymbiomonas proteolyticus TaxID=2608984 RepID=A0A809RAR4_9BACT|nr:Zn-dependent hydrolase [Candidatus Nitrosymbiomonas proteolyticus]
MRYNVQQAVIMYLKAFFEPKLAQYSYLLGCPGVGEAIVVDASRDVEGYIREAASQGMRIVAVTETHIHADYLSGSRELAHRTGARLYLSNEGGEEWKYDFASEPNVTLLHDGCRIEVGGIQVQAIHTPGHTPEHLVFLVTDTSASAETPVALLTGDFVFVGDVGRPDLLERAAHYRGTMEPGARNLYRSLQKLGDLPDSLLILPAHGAGSACGKSLGGVPFSTLGYERRVNWALRASTEDGFVSEVLAGQPEPPKYFAQMKRLNKLGPDAFGERAFPVRKPGSALREAMEQGAIAVDIRLDAEFAQAHVPGSLNIPLYSGFPTYAGWVLPYDRPIVLIAQDQESVRQAVRDLSLIGLDRVDAWFGVDAVYGLARNGETLGSIGSLSTVEAAERAARGDLCLLDVRGATEFEGGYIPHAQHVPYGYLWDRRDEVPLGKPVAAYCTGGGRSPVACSLLKLMGVREVFNVPGGFQEYASLGLPVASPESAATPT